MRLLILFFLLLSNLFCFSGTYTTINSGDWNDTSTWSGGSIAPITGNNNIINIGYGHNVILNNNITFGNGCELHVYGNLTINGDLTALNSLVIDVDGSLIINGNVIGKNGASITISGNASCTGNATFENNGVINMNNGSLSIGGTLTGGTGCEITGTGIINVQGPNNFDQTPATGVDVNPTLPIELVDFYAKREFNHINVLWSTYTETNNDYFELYKSLDAMNWKLITTTDGAGNSNSLIEYQYEDYDVYQNLIYYKLKQVDYDGAYKFVGIISVNNDIDETIVNIYPNPSENVVYIETTNIKCPYSKIEIYNVYGK